MAQAREIIERWVKHYNTERLHAGLGYLQPAVYYSGDPAARRSERTIKLTRARDGEKKDQWRTAENGYEPSRVIRTEFTGEV